MPSAAQTNCFFHNSGKAEVLQFEDWSAKAGFVTPTFSNGSAYADLDNDGDLDLVVNNLDSQPSIYKNKTAHNGQHWLTITCKDLSPNHFGLGAQVTIKTKDGYQFQEISPMRGFQSCTDYRLHFGLGDAQIVDTVWCRFAMLVDGHARTIVKTGVAANQILNLDAAQSTANQSFTVGYPEVPSANFTGYPIHKTAITDFVHVQGYSSDFDREPLLFQMYSVAGPALACADINGDGLEDCFIGGGVGQAGAIFMQWQRWELWADERGGICRRRHIK